MQTKTCSKCGLTKPVDEFQKAKRNTDGLRGWCKSCARQYVDDHIEEKREYEKNNVYKRRTKMNEYASNYRKRHPDRIKPKTEERKRKDKLRTSTQEFRDSRILYRKLNIDKIREKELIYHRKRRLIPEVRVKNALRARLQTILKRSNGSKSGKMIDLIGCTMPFLRTYLESKWKQDMSWDNYGKDGWVMDHIVPCDSFDLTDPIHQRKCFHYTNIQPLWWEENATKSNKMPS